MPFTGAVGADVPGKCGALQAQFYVVILPPGCGALRAPHPGLCMVRPSGPNLANLPFYCRKAAEALTALKCQLDKGLH